MSFQKNRLKHLDGVRGVAVLLVILNHFPVISIWGGDYFNKFFYGIYAGYIGVDLFFVLSGYLITKVSFVEYDKGIFSIKKFFIKRFFRIFPLYYLVIFIFIGIINLNELIPLFFYFGNYYYIFNDVSSGFRHTWSLCVEEHFYLIFPLIFIASYKKYFKMEYFILLLLFFIIISIVLSYVYMLPEQFRSFVSRSTNTRILSIIGGVYFALLEYKGKLNFLKNSTIWFVFLLSMFSLPLLRFIFENKEHIVFMRYISSFFWSSSLVLLLINNKNKNLMKVLSIRPLAHIGTISYGVYLWHEPILFSLGYSHSNLSQDTVSLTIYILILILVYLISYCSYRFFEFPLIKYSKEKIITK